MGRFVKLFGKTAFYVAAIAEALRIANGFLPVRVELPPPVPTRLFVPDDLSLSFMIFLAIPLAVLLYLDLSLSALEFEEVIWFALWEPLLFVEEDEEFVLLELELDMPILISGCSMASNLNCSML